MIIYLRKKAGFYYKNNHRYNKLANSRLNIISKINLKILIVILYTLLELESKNI